MPTKKKKDIRRELLDELLAGYSKPEDLTGPDGLLKQLTGALVERALQAEMTDHLGYEPHAAEGLLLAGAHYESLLPHYESLLPLSPLVATTGRDGSDRHFIESVSARS